MGCDGPDDRRRAGARATGRPRGSPTAWSSAGSRGGWSGARARSATAASWPIRAAPTCARSSTPRSSSARSSGRSRLGARGGARASTSTGSVPDPFMMQVYPVRADKRAVIPGGHARRRIGPAADREPRRQPALLGADPRLRAPHRRADPAEHVVQRERADRATSRPKRSTVFCARGWTCWCSATTSITIATDRHLPQVESRIRLAVVRQPHAHRRSSTARSIPDTTATGQLLTDLCEDLVRDHGCRVSVVAGVPLLPSADARAGDARLLARETHNGIEILRARGTRFSKKRDSPAARPTTSPTSCRRARPACASTGPTSSSR